MGTAFGAEGLVLDLSPAGVRSKLSAADEANKSLFSAFCLPVLVKSRRVANGAVQFCVSGCLYRGFHLTIKPVMHYSKMKAGLRSHDITQRLSNRLTARSPYRSDIDVTGLIVATRAEPDFGVGYVFNLVHNH
jgi:hypothetical protein